MRMVEPGGKRFDDSRWTVVGGGACERFCGGWNSWWVNVVCGWISGCVVCWWWTSGGVSWCTGGIAARKMRQVQMRKNKN